MRFYPIIFLLKTFMLLFTMSNALAQNIKAVNSGIPWYDEKNKTVSAHGANIIKEKDKFYLFGEFHSDTSNAFAGFSCYSSTDLANWKFESIALPLQKDGKLGPNRVGERPKVMKCPTTQEFVMYMHVDTLGYRDQFVGYATSKHITGPYIYKGALLFNNKPIKKWDMGVFQDNDGSGYVLLHGGDIYKLNDDYRSIGQQINKAMTSGFESPAMFKKDGIYYFLGSHTTGWERNDNYYFTSTSLNGPWKEQGLFTPKDKLTWNSQTTYVLPIQVKKDTIFMFMGDRWSFPKQNSAATYVWQPLSINGQKISIPTYYEGWKINPETGKVENNTLKGKTIKSKSNKIKYSQNWKKDSSVNRTADKKGDNLSLNFKGKQIAWYGLSKPNGGYVEVLILDNKKDTILNSIVDMYAKNATSGLKFLSPVLAKGKYTLTLNVLEENWYWIDKRKNKTGSKGYAVTIDKFLVKK